MSQESKALAESQIEAEVCGYAERRGALTFKFSSPNRRGVPDRIFIFPGGKAVFIEFKSAKGKLSPLQKRTFDKLWERGCRVSVVRSVETGREIVDKEIADWRRAHVE